VAVSEAGQVVSLTSLCDTQAHEIPERKTSRKHRAWGRQGGQQPWSHLKGFTTSTRPAALHDVSRVETCARPYYRGQCVTTS
jgi:hypothetical protein